jgi:hypothetical protein
MYWKDGNVSGSYLKDDHDNNLIMLVAHPSGYAIQTADSALGFIFGSGYYIIKTPYLENAKGQVDRLLSNWVYNNFLKEE